MHVFYGVHDRKKKKNGHEQKSHHLDGLVCKCLLLPVVHLIDIHPVNCLVSVLCIVFVQDFANIFAFLVLNESQHGYPFDDLEEID